MAGFLTGIAHIHSTYSFDGESSIKQIASAAQSKGHSFILLTEHTDDFDDRKMLRFVDACANHSSDRMAIIPGLEISCDFGRHVLALGIRTFIPMDMPESVITRIREVGGLAVLPHPGVYGFHSFFTNHEGLNGVEVWNSRYDGKHAPNPKNFELLKKLREANKAVYAYSGQDLHSSSDIDDLCLAMEIDGPRESEIMHCLQVGAFEIRRKRLKIAAVGSITQPQKIFFDIAASARMVTDSFRKPR